MASSSRKKALWEEDPSSPPVNASPDIEEKLREHGPYLIRNLNITPLFWEEMFSKGVFSKMDLKDLKFLSPMSKQIGELIDNLHRVPVYKFHRFLQCLHATEQDDIIRTLGFNPEDYPISFESYPVIPEIPPSKEKKKKKKKKVTVSLPPLRSFQVLPNIQESEKSPPVARHHQPLSPVGTSLKLSDDFWLEMDRHNFFDEEAKHLIQGENDWQAQVSMLMHYLKQMPVEIYHRFCRCLHQTNQTALIRDLGIKPEDYAEAAPRVTVDKESPAGKILEHLGLTDYYPGRISLQMVMAWCPERAGNQEEQGQIFVMHFLQKLIMLDYRARDQDSCSSFKNKKCNPQTQGGMSASGGDIESLSSKAEDSIDKLFSDMTDGEDQSLLLNPVDTFLTIFHCCDLMLRQVLAHKMFMCRLAVPFIVPDLLDDSYSLALWALRGIVVEWKMQSQETCESSVVSTPLNIISFVRVGRPHYSKSKLMNMILSDHGHNTFCNVDSPQGNKKHMISESLVETAWFLPAGKETDVLKNATMLLNLRGDASKCKQSIKVLSNVSDLMVAFVCPADFTDEHNLQTLLDIHKKCSKVVVFFVLKDIGDLDKAQEQLKSYDAHIGEEEKKNRVLVINFERQKEKNLYEIKQEMAKAFAETIPMRATKSLEDVCKAINNANFSIDEMDTACQSGKILSEKVMQSFPCDKHAKKSDLFPLQACWVEWSKLQKEQKQSKGATTIIEKEKLYDQMKMMREQQLDISKDLSLVVTSFLSGIHQAKTTEETQFFLQWLKLSIDCRSREILPTLWRKLREQKRSKGFQSTEANATADDIKNASIGFEHFFREIGQMYEAVETSRVLVDEKTQNDIRGLPEIFARHIHSGYPLEIMDGDASNVPITWLKAVFSSVKKQTGNAKIVVLSVLGIQSSGKSTLLNTMFGLHFAVSAGRCTHGVYAQLVKTHGYGWILPFDYILVVDTEGLRSSELSVSDYNHDNALATFVVGLGDMTIVNIKGENGEEVKDILQIVAHAFLRMQLISQGSEHQKTCMFVHQNVSAIDAISKMMDGNMTLTATLDKIVEEAAIAERQEHIQKFSQVLSFDLDNKLWCLPDLFIGDPPMAPVNTGYSESVQKIKSEIITHFSHKQSTHANFTDLTDRLENIWDAILSEDFVFSFRNSRAARAYAALEEKYSILHWEFEKQIQAWKYCIGKPKLEMCTTCESLESVCIMLIEELQNDFRMKITEACAKLKEIFLGEWRDLLIQWKAEKVSSLDLALSKVINQTETDIKEMKVSFSFDIRQKANHENHIQVIIEKAQQVARDLKGQTSESKLDEHFERLWVEWVSDLPVSSNVDAIDISHEVKQALRECFTAGDQAYLGQELKWQRLSNTLETLVGSFKLRTKEAWMHTPLESASSEQPPFIDCILESVTVLIQKTVSRNVNFDKTIAKEIINKIIKLCEDEFEKFAHHETDLNNLSAVQVQIAVLACRYAMPHFTDMHERYRNKHSIKMKIEEHKSMTYKIFTHSVLQSGIEVLAADLIMNEHMESQVKTRIVQDLNLKIADHLRSEIGCTKYAFMVKILEHLAYRNNFEEYMKYISHSKAYAHEWVDKFGNDLFFNNKNIFFEFAKAMIQKNIHSIGEAVKKATEASSNLDEISRTNAWLDEFSRCLIDTVNLNKEEMQQVRNYTFSNVNNLKKLLLEHLTQMEGRLREYFQRMKYEAVEWGNTKPYDLVCDSLWGCSAQCPFCKETCQKTDPKHSKIKGDFHQCLQHRPKGISGMYYIKSTELSVESCNFAVHVKTKSFICRRMKMKSKCNHSTPHTDNDGHYFHDYKSAYPDWDIPPSATMDTSTYWKWFLAKYVNKLIDYHKVEKPDMPPSWSDITKEEAVGSLATEFSGWH